MGKLISELFEPVRSWAKENQRNASECWDKETDVMCDAFGGRKTPQGFFFWYDVDEGATISILKEKYPHLDWGDEKEKEQPKKLWEWVKLFEEGVELEYQDCYEDWNKIHTVNELLIEFENRTIRIKPKPKVVELYRGDYLGWEIDKWQELKDTHRITFELDEKGNPICDTVKMEEIKNQKTK